MIFPKGEVVHRNLSTAYTDFSALLSTLKLEEFCGSIEVDFPGAKGLLFIDSGEILNGEVQTEEGSKKVVGPEAAQTLLALSKQKEGVINIYRLLPEQVALIANHLDNEALFKGLSTHYIRLEQFLQKLKEDQYSGFIEVTTQNRHPMGVIFIEGGEPVEMFTTPKTGPSVFGRLSIPIFIKNATQHKAFFNVYGKKGLSAPVKGMVSDFVESESPQEKGLDCRDLLPLFQDLLFSAERLVDSLSSGGTFKKAFKKALIAKSEEFGFLDPFAGEFQYGNGTIQFNGETDFGEFARGMIECFRFTRFLLEEEFPKDKMVSLKLKAGIESFIEQHKEILRRLELGDMFLSLLQ